MSSRQLQKFEEDALNVAGELLKFAAQYVKDLPTDMIGAITTATGAKLSDAWDDTVAARFWEAFNQLCVLVKPVTYETLVAALPEKVTPSWLTVIMAFISRTPIPQTIERTYAQSIANIYLRWLFALLFLAVCLSSILSYMTTLTATQSGILSDLDTLTQQMQISNNSLTAKGATDLFGNGEEQLALQSIILKHNQKLTQLFQNSRVLSFFQFGLPVLRFESASYQQVPNTATVQKILTDYYKSRDTVTKYMQYEEMQTSIFKSSVLPILLGLMGACTYVVRLISDQIKERSFSRTSPIRHRVRLWLGGLAGVVIGYGGIHGGDNLSPSALAFLAGYSVEPVFATFDAIAAKFRD